MGSKIYQSDLNRLLHLFAPTEYDLVVFDPDLRLVQDEPVKLHITSSDVPWILVSLAPEIRCHKGRQLH